MQVTSHRARDHAPIVVLVLLAVAYVVATAAGWSSGATFLFPATTCGAAVVAAVALRRLPRGRRRPWMLVVGGTLATSLCDLAWGIWYEVAGDLPDQNPLDAGYLIGTAVVLVGFSSLAVARFGPFDLEATLDSFLVSGTLIVIGWEPVLEPTIADHSTGGWGAALVLVAYPVLDLALVSTAAVIVAMRSHRTRAMTWLLLAATCLLVADSAQVVSDDHAWSSTTSQTALDVLWLAAAIVLPLAVRSADARQAATQAGRSERGLTNGRLVIATASLVAPAAAVVVAGAVGEPPDLALVVLATVLGVAATVSRLRRSMAADDRARGLLAHQQAYFRDLVEHASDAVIVFATDGSIVDATPSVLQVYGYTDAELRSMSSLDLIHPDDLEQSRRTWWQVLAEPDAVVVDEMRAPRADGSEMWLSVRYTNRIHASAGGVIANIADITARKHAELELTHQALHDGLTGLANRTLLMDRLAHSLRRRRPGGVALLYLDLDRFKIVNDSLGHTAGDQLLVTVAERLTATVRSCDTVARLGGDEFAVLVEGDGEPVTVELLQELADRLLAAVRGPIAVGTTEVVVGTSIGIASADAHSTAHDLLRDADVALYAAKAQGRDRFALFDQRMQSAARDRLQLETDLRLAIERQRLHLQYQPIVDMDTMELTGFEALVRWRHPERGLIGPDTFIPIAEETGLVVPLGAWVLGEALRVAALAGGPTGRATGPSRSASTCRPSRSPTPGWRRPSPPRWPRRCLPPELVVLELTETALVQDPAAATARLHELKELGVRLAIDDFGTGYSSLGYLRQFPIDVLKIDRSFLDPGTAETGLPPIVRGVLDLGATMGLTTIAEGVETDAQMARLMESGCRFGQGYLFARPLDAADAEQLARRVEPLLHPAASATAAV